MTKKKRKKIAEHRIWKERQMKIFLKNGRRREKDDGKEKYGRRGKERRKEKKNDDKERET